MNRRGIIPECAIEISTDLSGIVIHPKSVIQNLNHLLDALSDQVVIIGLYVKEAFSNSNEARFYVGNFRLVPRPITLQSPRYLLPKPAAYSFIFLMRRSYAVRRFETNSSKLPSLA